MVGQKKGSVFFVKKKSTGNGHALKNLGRFHKKYSVIMLTVHTYCYVERKKSAYILRENRKTSFFPWFSFIFFATAIFLQNMIHKQVYTQHCNADSLVEEKKFTRKKSFSSKKNCRGKLG